MTTRTKSLARLRELHIDILDRQQEELDLIEDLVASGPIADVAAQLGITVDGVYKRLRRAGRPAGLRV